MKTWRAAHSPMSSHHPPAGPNNSLEGTTRANALVPQLSRWTTRRTNNMNWTRFLLSLYSPHPHFLRQTSR